jgi:hypothetical protein
MEVGGHPGYLANITSQAKLNFIEAQVIPGGSSSTANVWVGGQRAWGSELMTWEWTGGAETGVVFWNNGPVAGKFAPWDPQYGCPTCQAGPNTTASWGVYLNAWYRPYITSAWDQANYTGVEAGANTGFVVEYGAGY